MTPFDATAGTDSARSDPAARPSRRFRPAADEQGGGPPAPRVGVKRADVILGAVLALVVFGGNLAIERFLDRVKVLDQYDVLFNTDPITRLYAISHGQGDYGVNLHPGLGVYYSRPIRLMGKVARASGLIADDRKAEAGLRRSLGLLVVPMLSGLGMAGVFLFFVSNRVGRGRALLMASACGLSFTQLVFGSLPDHFAVTGFFLVVLSWLASDLARTGVVRWVPWLVAGGLATGNTATNVVPVVVLFATPQLLARWPLRRVARNAAVLSVVSVATFGALLPFARKLSHVKKADGFGVVRAYTANYLRGLDGARQVAATIPRALLDTFAPAGLVTTEMPRPILISNMYSSGRAYRMFGLDTASRPWLPALACGLTLAGAVSFVRRDNPLRAVGLASVAVLAFNLTLHSFWGNEFFVYAQHWLVPLAVVLAGNLTWPGRAGRGFACLYAALVVGIAVNNYGLMSEIVSTLRLWNSMA